jgi:hypothetical protein
LVDVASRKVLHAYPKVGNAAIFPDGRHIATLPPVDYSDVNRPTAITIVDENGESRGIEYDEGARDLAVAPDGRHIVVAGPVSVSLLNAETGETTFRHGNQSEIQAFGFLPDGKRFALSIFGESVLRVYDAATGRQIDSIPCEPEGTGPWIEFSRDGKRVAMSFENDVAPRASIYGASIYDMQTGERLPLISGHTGPVNAAYFSPDGRRLFTRGTDGTLRLWDVENGFELLSLSDGSDVERRIFPAHALSPDGRTIAIPGPEGVFLKEAATADRVAAWQRPPTDTKWWQRLGGIQDWLVLAPIRLREQDDHTDDLDKQQLSNEAHLDPSADDEAPVDGEKLIWKRAPTSDCVLDFQKVTSPKDDHCLAYAVTHIYSDAPRKGVRLLVGSDDFTKVYLNGKPIYECPIQRAAVPADDEVQIDLRKGKNVLVCKVIDDEYEWGVSAQVVGDDYRPIPGVTTGTNL